MQSVWAARQRALRRAASQTWRHLWGEPLPGRVKVHWVPWLGDVAGEATIGGAYCGGEIRLDWAYANCIDQPLEILLHEFLHARGMRKHGVTFRRELGRICRKLGLEPETLDVDLE